MRSFSHILLITICLFLVSCNSLYYVRIDTMKPAVITLVPPEGNSRILLVNNTVPQPSDIGLESKIKGKSSNSLILDNSLMDSLLWWGTREMGYQLNNAQIFENVSLYNKPIRQDKEWMTIIPLPEPTANTLYEETNADVIVSIDRLLYLYNQQISITPYNSAHIDVKAEATLSCSVYHRGKAKPFTSVTVTDSIKDYLLDVETDSTNLSNIPEVFLYHITKEIVDQIVFRFIPEWTTSTRTIYTNSSARMKEALAYTKKEKWAEAAAYWIRLFDEERDSVKKARLAHNIAVSYEIRDDLATAADWMKQSEKFYLEANNHVLSSELKTHEDYLKILQQRIQDNELLDVQLR